MYQFTTHFAGSIRDIEHIYHGIDVTASQILCQLSHYINMRRMRRGIYQQAIRPRRYSLQDCSTDRVNKQLLIEMRV